MPEAPSTPQKNKTDEHKEKYFSFQIKGWASFDPMTKTLARVAEGIEEGNGFLTLVEVLQVEDDLASIGDEEVRECFANILAAKRLVRNVHELPKQLVEELRLALTTEEVVAPKKPVATAPVSPVVDPSGSGAKNWP
jgi:hypothetical protein